jgi:hypothetical protein
MSFSPDGVETCVQHLTEAREMRRGRKLGVAWAEGDDAASLRARYRREQRRFGGGSRHSGA